MNESNFITAGRFLEILGKGIQDAEASGLSGPEKKALVVNGFIAQLEGLGLPVPEFFQDKERMGKIVNILVVICNILADGRVDLKDLQDFSGIAGNLVALLKGH